MNKTTKAQVIANISELVNLASYKDIDTARYTGETLASKLGFKVEELPCYEELWNI